MQDKNIRSMEVKFSWVEDDLRESHEKPDNRCMQEYEKKN